MQDRVGNVSGIRWAGRGLVVFTALVWLACGSDGEVATTMMCPEGETCSEMLTGARFTGTSPSDSLSQRLSTAIGGRQRVGIAAPLLSGVRLPTWHAVSSDPSVFVVDSESGSSVTLLGVGSGSAFLRVLDSSDNLIDRIRFGAEHIEGAELVSPLLSLFSQAWEGPYVYMHGSEQRVVAALSDADGGRLVDLDASFVLAEGVVPSGWDAAMVTFPMTGDTLPLFVETGAGEHLLMEATMVDGIDAIQRYERVPGEADVPLTFAAERSGDACFISMLGEAAAVGAVLSIETTDPITAELTMHGALTCVSFSSDLPGEYSLELSGPGATLSISVTVSEARP